MNQTTNYAWRCRCGKPIMNDSTGNPASKYYSVEYKEVYCSAECSLKAYQQRKNI